MHYSNCQNFSFLPLNLRTVPNLNKMQPTKPNAHTYVNGTDVETWICSHAEHFSAIVYLNGLVHIFPVTSPQCGVESVECGVWSGKCGVWSVKKGVWIVKCGV